MRSKNEKDNLAPTLTDADDNSRRPAEDYGTMAAMTHPYQTKWPTLNMTATWGS